MSNKSPELNDGAEQGYFWIKFLAATVTFACLFFGRWIVVRLAALRLALRGIDVVEVPDGDFVKRPDAQRELLTALASEYYKTVFVYGQRGSGKTSLIQHALQGEWGVLDIKVRALTGEAASTEFIAELSSELDIFSSPEKDKKFVQDVFAACWVSPVVVVSLEPRCTGEVLEAVLTMCKILCYERRFRTTARFVVNLSGSRAAIDSSIQLEDMRCAGVHVGHFSQGEALMYATERAPTSFVDQNRRNQIARAVVEAFDWRVLTLQWVCEHLRGGRPGDLVDVNDRIEEAKAKELEEAAKGWTESCLKLSEALGDAYDPDAVKVVVKKLEQGPQSVNEIVTDLSKKSTKVQLSPRLIGLFNAGAGYHPLVIDPFESKVSLSGKAIRAVLAKKYK